MTPCEPPINGVPAACLDMYFNPAAVSTNQNSTLRSAWGVFDPAPALDQPAKWYPGSQVLQLFARESNSKDPSSGYTSANGNQLIVRVEDFSRYVSAGDKVEYQLQITGIFLPVGGSITPISPSSVFRGYFEGLPPQGSSPTELLPGDTTVITIPPTTISNPPSVGWRTRYEPKLNPIATIVFLDTLTSSPKAGIGRIKLRFTLKVTITSGGGEIKHHLCEDPEMDVDVP